MAGSGTGTLTRAAPCARPTGLCGNRGGLPYASWSAHVATPTMRVRSARRSANKSPFKQRYGMASTLDGRQPGSPSEGSSQQGSAAPPCCGSSFAADPHIGEMPFASKWPACAEFAPSSECAVFEAPAWSIGLMSHASTGPTMVSHVANSVSPDRKRAFRKAFSTYVAEQSRGGASAVNAMIPMKDPRPRVK